MAELAVHPSSQGHCRRRDMRVGVPGPKRQRNVEACRYLASPRAGDLISARADLQAASFLNFLERVAPSIRCHLRACWGLLTKNGIMGRGGQA